MLAVAGMVILQHMLHLLSPGQQSSMMTLFFEVTICHTNTLRTDLVMKTSLHT